MVQEHCPLCGYRLLATSKVTEEDMRTGRIASYDIVQCINKREHQFKRKGNGIYGMSVKVD